MKKVSAEKLGNHIVMEELYPGMGLFSYRSTDIPMDIRVCCEALNKPIKMRSRVICLYYTMDYKQRFLNSRGHQKHLLAQPPGLQESGLGWSMRICNCNKFPSSQVSLMLLVQKPHAKNHQIKMYYNILKSHWCPILPRSQSSISSTHKSITKLIPTHKTKLLFYVPDGPPSSSVSSQVTKASW